MPKYAIISAHCKDEREFTEFPAVCSVWTSQSKSGTHVLTAITVQFSKIADLQARSVAPIVQISAIFQ